MTTLTAHHGGVSRQETLDAGRPSRSGLWWADLPPRRRRGLTAAAAVVAVVVASLVVVDRARDLLDQRARRDRVAISARLDVDSVSTTPPGGSVWFTVLVRNDADVPVRLESLHANGSGLTITLAVSSERALSRLMPLQSGRTIRLLLSVVLDCPARTEVDGTDRLTVRLDATPTSRRTRSVEAPLEDAVLLTDVADTACRYDPDAAGVELSGPVLRR